MRPTATALTAWLSLACPCAHAAAPAQAVSARRRIEMRLAATALTAWLSLAYPCVHAAEPAQATTHAAVVLYAADAPPPLRHPAAAQLQTGEVAALLDHLQSQHVYLKHLENVRRALEKELSIVRLRHECGLLGSACTGRGIAEQPPPEEPPPAPEQTPPAAVPPSPAPPLQPLLQPSPPAGELPTVAGVYRGAASLVYRGRRVEVREGGKVGPFTVTAVTLDRVEINGPEGTTTLPAQWRTPAAPAVIYETREF